MGYILHRRSPRQRKKSDYTTESEELTRLFGHHLAKELDESRDAMRPLGESGDEALRANFATKFALQRMGIKPKQNLSNLRNDPYLYIVSLRENSGFDHVRRETAKALIGKKNSLATTLRRDLGEQETRIIFGPGKNGDQRYKQFIQLFLRYYKMMQRIPLKRYERKK